MRTHYEMQVAGLTRKLPLCPISDDLYIGAFILFGDVELTVSCAKELLKLVPEYDVMITAESKGIPLVYEMTKQAGLNKYLLARKSAKLYMRDVVNVEVQSITTEKRQQLYIDRDDSKYMNGKKVLIVDDVISTGESVRAVEKLVQDSGGIVAGRMAILAEGDACKRDDIVYLARLPLFNSNGDIMD